MAEFKRLSANEINKRMAQIKAELDIVVPTELHMVQQSYSTLIFSSGERRGQVRTYQEAVQYRKEIAQKYNQPYRQYTQKEYVAGLEGLTKVVEKYRTVSTAMQTYRDGARQLIAEYNEQTGAEIDVDTIPFDTLKEVLDKATEAVGKRSKDRNDSPKLFKYMHQYFAEEGVRNIGEPPRVD